MPAILIDNAQIKTTAVEIKTLTVSGKQVTLSVFRQIQEEDLIDIISLKINGIPWGNINYFFGENKDKNGTDYYNILWQKGNELRRSVVCKKSHQIKIIKSLQLEINNKIERINNYMCEDTDYILTWRHSIDFNIPVTKLCISEIKNRLDKVANRSGFVYHERRDLINFLNKYKCSHNVVDSYVDMDKNEIIKTLNSALKDKELLLSHNIKAYEETEPEELKNLKYELNEKITPLNNILNSLKDLPQLFIAI